MTIVVMGVSGSGKTTVGIALAERLSLNFFDADLVHSVDARDQMHRGIPLSDAQRDAWIARVIAEIETGPPRVVACSALRRLDRDRLRAVRPTRWFLLDVPSVVLAQRLADRREHFFPPALLDSQLDRFEAPTHDEDIVVIDGDRAVAAVVDDIAARITS